MAYPVDLTLDAPPKVANWRPLVHWFLAIPHMLLTQVLSYVAGVVAIISWFAILFTGKLPVGLANFGCLMIRYQARTYSYVAFLREPYPPFDFSMTPEDPGGDPLRVDIRPQLEDRNRLTVFFRVIMLIPIAIFLMVIGLVAWVCVVIAFFAVLFTGRWPEGLRDFVVGAGRLGVRVSAYCYLLVDDYPPFSTAP